MLTSRPTYQPSQKTMQQTLSSSWCEKGGVKEHDYLFGDAINRMRYTVS